MGGLKYRAERCSLQGMHAAIPSIPPHLTICVPVELGTECIYTNRDTQSSGFADEGVPGLCSERDAGAKPVNLREKNIRIPFLLAVAVAICLVQVMHWYMFLLRQLIRNGLNCHWMFQKIYYKNTGVIFLICSFDIVLYLMPNSSISYFLSNYFDHPTFFR